jgi:transglutaminase-like putative cysteine protease
VHYTIHHVTKFSYETPVRESVMEVRMQPRTESTQRCVRFGLSTTPASRVKMYDDRDGNTVHHFNIPGRHSRLLVTAEALVEMQPAPILPDSLGGNAWERLDALTVNGEFWDQLNPSHFAQQTPLLDEMKRDLQLDRGADPLATLRRLTTEMFQRFEYSPQATRVDSPIDDALGNRRGVCQDFAHIMIALVRGLGIPCRYVSGYLFRQPDQNVRSTDGATHAWIEALLPEFGWVGFDPTNDLVADERHIRVAVGRDYADVPPTRGVFKGASAVHSELGVAVTVGTAWAGGAETTPLVPWRSREATPVRETESSQQQQQQ